MVKVSKSAKIRNQYNQIPHLTQDTNGKVAKKLFSLCSGNHIHKAIPNSSSHTCESNDVILFSFCVRQNTSSAIHFEATFEVQNVGLHCTKDLL